MSTISSPSTPLRVHSKPAPEQQQENQESGNYGKGFLDSSPIASKIYNRDDAPLTPVRTPLKDSANFSSPFNIATSPLAKVQSKPTQYSHAANTAESNTVIIGSFLDKVTVGRCSAASYQVGRRNRLLSRIHLSINWNESSKSFELTVLGLNGLKVDEKPCQQKEKVALHNGSIIDIVGEVVRFQAPGAYEEQSVANANELDIYTPTHSGSASNQDGLFLPKQHNGNALSERLLAVVAESKRAEDVAAATEPQPLEPIATEAKEVVEVKDEREEESIQQKFEPKQDEEKELVATTTENVEIENIEAVQKLDITLQRDDAQQTEEDTAGLEVKHEASEEINIEVAEQTEQSVQEETSQNEPLNTDVNYAEMIIEALVFSRKSSMPISDIYTRIMTTNPAYKSQSLKLWLETIAKVLQENEFFGQITRKGKTADGTPKENLYYYRSDKDPVEWRQATYTQVGRSARKCTLQDKQYFWKIPPKLGRNRSSYIPPPAHAIPAEGKRGRTNKADEEEESQSKRLKKRKSSEEDQIEIKENSAEK